MSAIAMPYEKQNESQTSRKCGAACCSMVYRSLGKNIPQDDIWPAISQHGPLGGLASTTHLMARDALNRGFQAVIIQARHPLQALRLCQEWGIRAILSHSLQKGSPAGHYSVLVDLNDQDVILHDPLFGPARRFSHAELLALWRPQSASSEILGNVVIGIGGTAPAKLECEFCHTPLPPKISCPKCRKPVGLQPGAILGCMRDGCIARMWNHVCCPACDCLWTFSLQPHDRSFDSSTPNGLSTAAPKPEEGETDPWKLERFFGELNKFCVFFATLPAAVNRAELKQQLDFIAGSKERLKLAQSEELARIQAHHAKLDAQRAASKRRHESLARGTQQSPQRELTPVNR